MVPEGEPAPGFFEAYGQWMGTPPPSWDDLAWLREQWDGPFMLKGIMRVDDARRAADAGYSAISVSNHGGNNLDTTPASVRALPLIAEAVGDRVDVVMDGGIRRGSDVVKAVALGAKAVMIGRASLWALAVGGQAGVENVLDVLRNGVDSAMLGLGKRTLAELSPADIVVPEGFSAVPAGRPSRRVRVAVTWRAFAHRARESCSSPGMSRDASRCWYRSWERDIVDSVRPLARCEPTEVPDAPLGRMAVHR
jgi:pre-mycofactocin synthase